MSSTPSEIIAAAKIVMVDDDLNTLGMLGAMLASFGVTDLTTASTAREAFHAIKKSPPDLVITDWRMPGEGGEQLLQVIRGQPKQAISTIPVLVVTGYADQEMLAAALKAGATRVLTKPVDPKEFYIRIARCLGVSADAMS